MIQKQIFALFFFRKIEKTTGKFGRDVKRFPFFCFPCFFSASCAKHNTSKAKTKQAQKVSCVSNLIVQVYPAPYKLCSNLSINKFVPHSYGTQFVLNSIICLNLHIVTSHLITSSGCTLRLRTIAATLRRREMDPERIVESLAFMLQVRCCTTHQMKCSTTLIHHSIKCNSCCRKDIAFATCHVLCY